MSTALSSAPVASSSSSSSSSASFSDLSRDLNADIEMTQSPGVAVSASVSASFTSSSSSSSSKSASTATSGFENIGPFPVSLPSLRSPYVRMNFAASACKVVADSDLRVEREPHPVNQSRCLFLLHDRFHGSAHRNCGHRDPDLLREFSGLNSSVQEQVNRGRMSSVIEFASILMIVVRQRWNPFITQMKPFRAMLMLRLLTHLHNYEIAREQFETMKRTAASLGSDYSVGKCHRLLVLLFSAVMVW